ncbi:Thaumatin protein 1 [Spatholobus suberectus]|nr:Thaumatin protein 1 [Spatholobus suberectus]
MAQPTWLFSLLALTLQLSASGVNSATLTLANQCNYTVWPALAGNGDAALSTTGFILRTGESSNVTIPATWSGNIWGRTLCTPNSAPGSFSCVTGNCGTGKVECGGMGDSPPATQVGFNTSSNSRLDFYGVSLADGFNIPMTVVPVGGNCSSAGCPENLNAMCPAELNVTEKGQVVACRAACFASNSSTCEPNEYSRKFKRACPQAYTGTHDEKASLFSCSTATDYNVVFCPAASKANSASRSVGDSLIAGNRTSQWLSPSGDFAFGFYQLPNELFLLAIWYNKIPNRTIIWYANGDNLAPVGSSLRLNDSRGLVLSNPQGLELWRSNFMSGTIYSGLMNDDGQFQLLDRNFVSLWDSFTHPTDTLVPTQVMELNGELSSRQGEFNFSRGRFKLHLQEDGNLVLNRVNLLGNYNYKPYYDTGTADAKNITNVGMKLIFNESGFLYILKKSGEKFSIYKPNEMVSTNAFYKATINFDGVFTISYYPKDPKDGQRWVTTKAIPENICLNSTFPIGEGVCGFNSICNLKDDQRPMCNCVEGYSLINSSNMYGACIRNSLNPNEKKDYKKKDHDALIVVTSVLLGNSVLVNIMLVSAICFGFSCNRKKIKSSRTNNNVVYQNLHNFTFKELVEATSNFTEELGRGSFSIVYKGTMKMTSVAVKKLDKLFQDNDKEFQTEVNVIGQTHNRNLVRLLGYCNEGQHRILVYEFMSNGTLASFLFTPLKSNWGQ